MSRLSGTTGHVEGFQFTLQAHRTGRESYTGGQRRSRRALAVAAVTYVGTDWLAGQGIANSPTEAAAAIVLIGLPSAYL